MSGESILSINKNIEHKISVLIGILTLSIFPVLGAPRTWGQTPELQVVAPQKLEKALQEVCAGWQQEAGRPPVVITYKDGAALQKAVGKGSGVDLVIAAGPTSLQPLVKKGFVPADAQTELFRDRLVFVTATDWQLRRPIQAVQGFPLAQAMGRRGMLAMASPFDSADGRLFKAALESMEMWSPAMLDHTQEVKTNQEAIELAATSEVRLALVYQSDAAEDPRVRVVDTLPESSHPPIAYVAALAASSKHPGAAEFLERLHSIRAQEIFEKHGFIALP